MLLLRQKMKVLPQGDTFIFFVVKVYDAGLRKAAEGGVARACAEQEPIDSQSISAHA